VQIDARAREQRLRQREDRLMEGSMTVMMIMLVVMVPTPWLLGVDTSPKWLVLAVNAIGGGVILFFNHYRAYVTARRERIRDPDRNRRRRLKDGEAPTAADRERRREDREEEMEDLVQKMGLWGLTAQVLAVPVSYSMAEFGWLPVWPVAVAWCSVFLGFAALEDNYWRMNERRRWNTWA
jgi:hypothetical protein